MLHILSVLHRQRYILVKHHPLTFYKSYYYNHPSYFYLSYIRLFYRYILLLLLSFLNILIRMHMIYEILWQALLFHDNYCILDVFLILLSFLFSQFVVAFALDIVSNQNLFFYYQTLFHCHSHLLESYYRNGMNLIGSYLCSLIPLLLFLLVLLKFFHLL